jgi:hypothetical protein
VRRASLPVDAAPQRIAEIEQAIEIRAKRSIS